MKPRNCFRSTSIHSSLNTILAITWVASCASMAAVITWDGAGTGGTVLETAANWAGDVLPSPAVPDTATWNGSVAGNLSLTYAAGLGGAAGNTGLNLNLTATQTGTLSIDSATNTALRLNNVTLDSGSGAFTLGDGVGTGATSFAITLGGGASTQTWTNNSANTATVNSDVLFGLGGGGIHAMLFTGSGNWDVKNNLTVSNAATAGVQFSLQKTGAGTLSLSGGGSLKNGPTAFGGAFGSVFKEGVTSITAGSYAYNNTEIVVGGLDTVGTNTQLNLSNSGAVTGVSWLSIGRGNGAGAVSSDLTLNNSSTITATNMSGGFNAGNATTAPKGVVTLNNTSSITANTTVNIAESANSNITINLNGTSTFTQNTTGSGQTRLGMADGATGTLNVSGGTANFERDLILGSGGTGTGKVSINSGTVNVATTTERWLILNPATGTGHGEIVVNGGNLNLNTNTDIRMSQNSGSAGANFVTLTSGAITGYNGNMTGLGAGSVVDLGWAGTSAANNTFNLDGGTLTIGQVITNSNTPIATFNFNGGLLKAAGATANFVDLGGASQTAVVKSGGAKIDSNGFNITIPQALLDGGSGGGLTKQGAGTLTLSGVNTYTGATQVNGGTLAIAGTIDSSSGVTINGSGAKLTKANFGNLPAVTLTEGTLETNATAVSLNVANSATNTISPGAGTTSPMQVQNGLTFQGAAVVNTKANGALMENYILPTFDNTLALTTPGDGAANGQIVVSSTNVSTWSGGTNYPVVEYSTFSGSINDFVLGTVSGLSPRQTASLVDTGVAIALHIDGDSIRWTGNASSDWTTVAVGSPFNWILPSSSTNTEYLSGDVVLFDDSASNFSVNIAENLSPGSVVFDNTTEYTLTSTGAFGISGGAIIKNNSGTVVLATNNSYTGTTTINAGTLQIGNGGASGSISASSSIANNGELVINTSSAGTYANPITGTGNVTKSGTGTLTLSGNNTFAGNFTLNGGQLNLNNAAALGAGTGIITLNSATLDNTSGTVLNLAPNKNVTLNSDLTFLGSNNLFLSNGAVTINASRTFDIQAGIFGCGAVGDLAAGHSLIKTGTGTLVLNGGDIDGNLDIQNGIVGLNQDFHGAAFTGTGILQNAGNVGTKWTFWYGPTDVTTNTLIRNNDGSHTMQLGIVKRGSGTLSLTNASNVATANLSVDSGKLIVNGGTYGAQNDNATTNTGLTAIVGNTAAANGVLEINGATVNYNNRAAAGTDVWRSTLNVGNNGTGAGAVKLNTGTLTTDKQLALGITGSAFGAMTQTGGSATIGGFLALGLGTSQGVFNQTGGTFTLTTGPVTSGAGAGSLGVINLSGSAVYNHNSAANNAIWLGENGTGVMNVSGGAALTLPTNGVELGKLNVATASGTLNLLGGTVTTNYVSKPGAAATGRLNFNGGTLAANVASTTFLTGLTSARVHSAGGSINNGGNAITIGQALEAPTGNGVSASGLVASGSGFIDTPLVTITGDGTGATAVANVDSSGNLTGITITSPGAGYTTPPTFTLSGGGIGNTGGITGSATLVPNTSGGMTFSGAAVTTLTGVNTYSGNTTINSGTVVVTNGAALTVAPTTNGVSTKITGAGAITLQGTLRVLLSGANQTNGNSWTLVDATTRTYDSTFKVSDPVLGDFTAQGDGVTHTLVDGTKTWTYSETSGALSLSIVSAGYSSWITGFGLGAGDQDPSDDPDGDGFNNLMEYVLGGNPNSSNTSIAPTGSKSGSNFIVTFTRNDTAVSGADVAISLDYGNDLVGWTSVAVPASSGVVGGVTFTITNGSPNDTVTASIPTASAAKLFARVKGVK